MSGRRCAECGEPYGATSHNRPFRVTRFCSERCKRTFNNRRMTRGAPLYDAAMRWRKERTPGAFTDLCHLLSGWIGDDAEERAGLPSYNHYRNGVAVNAPPPRGRRMNGED